ncbi:MAG: hypothetical protein HFACDABA_03118 [Anaerolineales bacterium]|nr:hypothetical protein [Anaerolineales bacterium]
MPRIFFTWLTILFLLTACAPAITLPAATPTNTLAPVSSPALPTFTLTASPSPVPTPSRRAELSQVEPLVQARVSDEVAFSAAAPGITLPVGGEAQTGEEGRARLDLAPDGTIIRLAPNTHFALSKLDEEAGNPFTDLELFFGQLYILLSGGELQVQTPAGVASVRGSMMGVSYDHAAETMIVTCLEGHCSLQNEGGRIELVAGQAADIIRGNLARGPRSLTDGELYGWLENAPELNDFPDLLGGLRERIDKLPKLPRRR